MAKTETLETTGQHVGEETAHVEPVTLTIEIEGATLNWTLNEHASAHYHDLDSEEQAAYRAAAGSALERVLDEGSTMLCVIAQPVLPEFLMSLTGLLSDPGVGIDFQVVNLGDLFGDTDKDPEDYVGDER